MLQALRVAPPVPAVTVALDRPVFVIGSARSGTTLVRACLERSGQLWRLGRGSQNFWEPRFHPLCMPDRNHILDASHATPEVRHDIAQAFAREVFIPLRSMSDLEKRAFLDRVAAQGLNPWYYDVPLATLQAWFAGPAPQGPPYPRATAEIPPFTFHPPSVRPTVEDCARLRIVDKDPAHAYRIPFLSQLFPDARFVFVVRDGRAAVSSLIEAWLHPRWFFSYRMPQPLAIEGYSDRYEWGDAWWNLQLPPHWEEWTTRTLPEVCAYMWRCTMEAMLAHAERITRSGRGVLVRYEDLVARPHATLEQIAHVTEISADDAYLGQGLLPQVATATPPSLDKWRANAARLVRAMPLIASTQRLLGYPAGL